MCDVNRDIVSSPIMSGPWTMKPCRGPLWPEYFRPLQQAWIAEDVPQCGYCQSGQIMAAAVLLREPANPTDEDINVGMAGNVCRCGTYQRIRRAIHLAAQLRAQGGGK